MENSAAAGYDYSWLQPWIEVYVKLLYIVLIESRAQDNELRVTTNVEQGTGIICECYRLDHANHPAYT